MGRFVDSIIAYRIIRMLITPFEETDAYRLGIIDAKGKELKKMRQLNTTQERDSYTILHRMIYRIKRIIEKVPAENKRLLNFAAALSLVKEQYEANHEPIELELLFLDRLKKDLTEEIDIVNKYFNTRQTLTFKQFMEEGETGVPANNAVATPGIDGFTPETIGVKKRKKIKLIRRGTNV